jgi:hypothetical protein
MALGYSSQFRELILDLNLTLSAGRSLAKRAADRQRLLKGYIIWFVFLLHKTDCTL